MRMTDVKLLWGKAANRCSFPGCRLELTVDGTGSTLGQMAHIVAKATDGPRGQSEMDSEDRDSYDNLILLCPTHHATIDADVSQYTVLSLRDMKDAHEGWVSKSLDAGVIARSQVDNAEFMESRRKEWIHFSADKRWVVMSLTPLAISPDRIDPLSPSLKGVLNSVKLPRDISCNSSVNWCFTHPNEYGIVNQDLRETEEGYGHKIQLFRNGHCEFLVCLEAAILPAPSDKGGLPAEYDDASFLPYDYLAKTLQCQIQGLLDIWHTCLPFGDMAITSLITNTRSLVLDSGRGSIRPWLDMGHKVSANLLEYTSVVSRMAKSDDVLVSYVRRLVSYLGLVLDNDILDNRGGFIKPHRLHN